MATADLPVDANTQTRRDTTLGCRQRFSSKSTRQAGSSDTPEQTGLVKNKGSTDFDVTSTGCGVFFSYSSKDKDWVIQTAERLEKDYGIECSYDSKDFIGGKAITSNIMKCIKMSRKTVLVLSPDFLRSPWCGYEMQIVLREHLFREEKVVIPVLLHDCIIPDFISHLTYLEVQDPQFWEKFLEILKTDNTENETLSGLFSFGHEADKFNGKTIARFSSNLDSSDVYNTLSSSGIRVTKEDIDCAFGTLRKTSLYRYCYRCFISKAIVMSSVYASMAMMAYILTQTIIYFVLLLLVGSPPWAIGLKSDPTSFVIYCLVIVLEIVLIASFFKVRRMRDEAERAVNYYLLSYDIIMGYMGTDHSSMQMVVIGSIICLLPYELLTSYLVRALSFHVGDRQNKLMKGIRGN